MERELYFFEYVDRTGSEVLAELLKPGQPVFQSATKNAVGEANRFKSRLHIEIAGFDIGRDVKAELGKPVDNGYAVYIPIKWRAATDAALFPSMDAELEVVSLGNSPPLAQVSLIGRYRPPLSVFGALGDAMLGHRIAEATVRHFVKDLAAQLEKGKQPG